VDRSEVIVDALQLDCCGFVWHAWDFVKSLKLIGQEEEPWYRLALQNLLASFAIDSDTEIECVLESV
jgi:hypothetical protein